MGFVSQLTVPIGSLVTIFKMEEQNEHLPLARYAT